MNFSKSVAPYLTTFYFLGMSPCRPNQTWPHNEKHRNPMIIVQILCILASVSCVILIYITSVPLLALGPAEIIACLYIACDIVKAFCVAFQCIIYESQMREISNTFHKLDSFFAIHLNHRIRYQTFRKKISTYALIIITSYSQYVMVFTLRGILENVFITYSIPSQFVHLMQSITYLHMIFYIEALTFYLSQLNLVIQKDMDTHATSKHTHKYKNRILMRNKIKCYKSVHFRLCEVSERINTFFGWTMIVIFSHAFVKFVYSAYWIFEEYQHDTGASLLNMKIIRKFS